jgi:hypothetical protein
MKHAANNHDLKARVDTAQISFFEILMFLLVIIICHPERSEGSSSLCATACISKRILRDAQNDKRLKSTLSPPFF